MLHTVTQGEGRPLLLVHGIGSSALGWSTVMPLVTRQRRVIALDLPGHGKTPAREDSGTFAGLAASLEAFLREREQVGIDMVGSSLGGRLVLEMARRGLTGNVVALNPGGFWAGWERAFLQTSLLASVFMLRGAGFLREPLADNLATRSVLMAQLSARPWALDAKLVAAELHSIAATQTFVELTNDLASIPAQEGPAPQQTGRVAIGWGRYDRLCFPVQAERAAQAFPSARMHWFERSGHYSWWDEPEQVARLIEETCPA